MKTNQLKRGLTWLEFLIVIAIVVILLGMFWPCNHGSREKARRSSCLNNLKQIGLAARLYAEDQGGQFPCDAVRTAVSSFALLTNRYQTSYKTWICPSDSSSVFAGSAWQPFTSNNVSYAYGGFGVPKNALPDTPIACDRSSAGDPTQVTPWQGNAWTHKSDGGNVLYADGHVSFTKRIEPPMIGGKNP